jgi:hypothetical protein
MDDAVVRFDIRLDHDRHVCQLLLGRYPGGFRTSDGILRHLDYDRRCRNRFALRLRSPFDFRDGGFKREHQDYPSGATDRERPAAKRFNLDFAV